MKPNIYTAPNGVSRMNQDHGERSNIYTEDRAKEGERREKSKQKRKNREKVGPPHAHLCLEAEKQAKKQRQKAKGKKAKAKKKKVTRASQHKSGSHEQNRRKAHKGPEGPTWTCP